MPYGGAYVTGRRGVAILTAATSSKARRPTLTSPASGRPTGAAVLGTCRRKGISSVPGRRSSRQGRGARRSPRPGWRGRTRLASAGRGCGVGAVPGRPGRAGCRVGGRPGSWSGAVSPTAVGGHGCRATCRVSPRIKRSFSWSGRPSRPAKGSPSKKEASMPEREEHYKRDVAFVEPYRRQNPVVDQHPGEEPVCRQKFLLLRQCLCPPPVGHRLLVRPRRGPVEQHEDHL